MVQDSFLLYNEKSNFGGSEMNERSTDAFSCSYEELIRAAEAYAEKLNRRVLELPKGMFTISPPSLAIMKKEWPAVGELATFLDCDRGRSEGVLKLLKGSESHIEIARTGGQGNHDMIYLINRSGLQKTIGLGERWKGFTSAVSIPAFWGVNAKEAIEAVETYHHAKRLVDARYLFWMEIWSRVTAVLMTSEPT